MLHVSPIIVYIMHYMRDKYTEMHCFKYTIMRDTLSAYPKNWRNVMASFWSKNLRKLLDSSWGFGKIEKSDAHWDELTVRLEQATRFVNYLCLSLFFAASCKTSSSVVRVEAGTGTGFDIQMASSVAPKEWCSSCVYKDWIMRWTHFRAS